MSLHLMRLVAVVTYSIDFVTLVEMLDEVCIIHHVIISLNGILSTPKLNNPQLAQN